MPLPYRDRVRVEYRAEEHGEEDPEWTTLAKYESVPCNIVGAGGGETNRGRQVEEHIRHEVEMRLRTAITEDMRLVVLTGYRKDRTLEIASINVIDRRATGNRPEMLLHCVDSGTN